MIDVVFNMVDVKLKNRIEDGCNVTKRKLGPVSEIFVWIQLGILKNCTFQWSFTEAL